MAGQLAVLEARSESAIRRRRAVGWRARTPPPTVSGVHLSLSHARGQGLGGRRAARPACSTRRTLLRQGRQRPRGGVRGAHPAVWS